MRRYLFSALVICLIFQSNAFGQNRLVDELRSHGRRIIQNQLQQNLGTPRQQPGGQQRSYSPNSLPSESGRNSGGNDGSFFPGDGEFILPGGGQVQPGNIVDPRFTQPGTTQPRYIQPNPQYQPDYGQPQYTQPRNDLGRTIYQPQPYQNVQPQFNSSQTIAQPYGSSEMPTSPVSSSQYIFIRFPSSLSGSLSYTLISDQGRMGFVMSSGQEQRFRASRTWMIEYNEGGVQKKYRLEGGKIYSFSRDSSNHWKLFAAKSS